MTTPANSGEEGTAPSRTGRTRRRRVSFTIGFRLDEFYIGKLEKGAAAYGISVHEYARQRLVEVLDRTEEARLLEECALGRVAVEELREDLARTLEILLANTTRAEPAAIRTWIEQNLRGR